MGKKRDKQKQHEAEARARPAGARQEEKAGPPPKMKRKAYEREMRLLHGELVAMQEWVKASRINDPRKIWKLSELDLKSCSRWYDYSRARGAMFAATDTAWAPWYVAYTDDKRRGRLNIISHLLSQVPSKPLAHRDITLPKRQRPGGYVEPDLPLRHIPTPF